MFIMFLMVGTMANHDRRFHERARIESLVFDRDYKGALKLIKQFGETDSVTSMLTIYSVARTGHLGDELFEYPLVGGSTVLRPGKVHSDVYKRQHQHSSQIFDLHLQNLN